VSVSRQYTQTNSNLPKFGDFVAKHNENDNNPSVSITMTKSKINIIVRIVSA